MNMGSIPRGRLIRNWCSIDRKVESRGLIKGLRLEGAYVQ
jgi:hypothetical protein